MGGKEKVLVIVAHPDINNSRGNKTLLAGLENMPEENIAVTVHHLYKQYADFKIDVLAEQDLLRQHTAIIWQYPLYWYSTPSLLKEWQDAVLTEGFALGQTKQTSGKKCMVALTTGAAAAAYQKTSGASMVEDLLLPLSSTAAYIGMEWYAPFIAYGVPMLSDGALKETAVAYQQHVKAFCDC